MNSARAQWQALTPSANGLLDDLRTTLADHPPTTQWSAERRREALALTEELRGAWQQERVALDALSALDALTPHLNLTGTVTCRAALEGLQNHFRRVVEATYEVLAAND